jgi:hypothetical protein
MSRYNEMKITADLTRKTLFKVKWTFMPPEKKYAYLWARTKKTWDQSRLSSNAYDRTDIIGG